MEEGYLICFEKELSKTDVTGNLEIPRDALHLPDAAENNEIMLVWDHGKIWNFQAPVRGDGRRRFMSDQWRQFAKDNSLMDRDVLKFYRSTAIVNFYVVTFELSQSQSSLVDRNVSRGKDVSRNKWAWWLAEVLVRKDVVLGIALPVLPSRLGLVGFSKIDATGNLEIPRDALYLANAAENNESMLVWDHGKIWNFKAPVRGDGTSGRYMSCQWLQFAKDNSPMDRDVLKFYCSTAIVNFYVVTFERALRIQLDQIEDGIDSMMGQIQGVVACSSE
ncbi:hypothetical protein TEA_024762 [Camellia sinensis var. sinensis]|uniref:TF-B3 domain-containing protein n=1 Tax=Camellia sinensis var. sinensis TaxID=542762 RepID=A0A4V6RYT4_CAMSN|nr:hypothetical protein TEA_024762 [Camellia sinensis var. sinensis]